MSTLPNEKALGNQITTFWFFFVLFFCFVLFCFVSFRFVSSRFVSFCFVKILQKPKHHRNRNAIWFKPPYGANVATDIGHKFLQAVNECFPPNHPLYKIFNRNTLKLSYSCIPNVHQIITAYNKNILNKQTKPTENPEKRMQLPPERILPPPWQMSNRKRSVPGHSNQRREPTE